MSLLEKYVEYAREGNAEKIASIFSEDADFYDEGPTALGHKTVIIKGRETIRGIFEKIFRAGGLDVSNVSINGNAMRYDVTIGGTKIRALGVMEEENGLISSYRITVP